MYSSVAQHCFLNTENNHFKSEYLFKNPVQNLIQYSILCQKQQVKLFLLLQLLMKDFLGKIHKTFLNVEIKRILHSELTLIDLPWPILLIAMCLLRFRLPAKIKQNITINSHLFLFISTFETNNFSKFKLYNIITNKY